MAYTLSCSSSTVVITNPQGTTSGTLSGTAYLQVTDTSTGRVVNSTSVEATGSIAQDGTQRSANGSFTLTVSWSRTAGASGSAAGTYGSDSLSTGVPVTVGHGGKSTHGHKGGKPTHKS